MNNKPMTVTILAEDFSEIDSYTVESIRAAKAAIVEHVQNAQRNRPETTYLFSSNGEAAIYAASGERIRTICYS